MTLPRGEPPHIEPTTTVANPRVRGTLLAVGGVLVLSPDTLLIRLIDLDPPTIVFARGVLTSLGVLLLVTISARWTRVTTWQAVRSIGRWGIVVACVSSAADLLFVVSLANTHVANTLVIFAAAPLLAAGLSRAVLKEPVRLETWMASFVALVAIAVIFSTSLGQAALVGDGTALAATALMATNLTLVRHHRHINMIPALILKGLIGAVVLAPFADLGGMTGMDAFYLTLDGFVIIPMAISMLMVAPRLIPAPDVALIHLLETGIGPIWVWLALGEVPPATTVAAGMVMLATLAVHSWLQMRRPRI